MHELSIALNVVEVAAETLRRHGGTAAVAVHLRVGAWSGVVKESLQSAFELAKAGSALENCNLQIDEVEVAMRCPTCRCERTVVATFDPRCSVCGSSAAEFVRGLELEVVAVEIEP